MKTDQKLWLKIMAPLEKMLKGFAITSKQNVYIVYVMLALQYIGKQIVYIIYIAIHKGTQSCETVSPSQEVTIFNAKRIVHRK